MVSSRFVTAPRRFSARSFLRPLVVANLTAGTLLFPLAVQAGTYTWTTKDANGNITAQSPTFSGGQWSSAYSGGPFPYEIGSSGTGTGDSSGQTDSSGDLTATFTWQPATGKTSTTDPPTPCIVKSSSSAYWTGRSPFNVPPICSDGLGDPEADTSSGNGYESGSSSGTHYRLFTPNNGVITVGLGGAHASISPVNVYSGSFGSGVEWSVSIVNGNWVGPYYFHVGYYAQGVQSNPTTSPWYNNMAGDYPKGTDTYDSNNIFQLRETTKPFAKSSGIIIPVWVWSGPNLPGGAAPPAFNITETTDAFAEDNTNGGGTDWDVDDEQGNSYVTNTANEDYVLDTEPNTTTVSAFNTPSGSVWWALGQSFDLTAYANGFGVYPPYDYSVFVGLSANLASQ